MNREKIKRPFEWATEHNRLSQNLTICQRAGEPHNGYGRGGRLVPLIHSGEGDPSVMPDCAAPTATQAMEERG